MQKKKSQITLHQTVTGSLLPADLLIKTADLLKFVASVLVFHIFMLNLRRNVKNTVNNQTLSNKFY